MSRTASSTGRVRLANGAARRTVCSSRVISQSSIAVIATICWASTSSGLRGMRSSSIAPSSIRLATTVACTRSPWYLGKIRPREMSPTLWPARPVRCSPLATDGGASTWMTRSTAPMSMPSSRLDVATTAGSRPAFSASSIWARSCRDTEPWCARATSAGTPWVPPDWAMTSAGERGAAVAPGPLLGALGSELVEPGAEPLGQAPRVREDDRGPVRLDLVEHALLDVPPDRAPSHRVVRALVVWSPGRGLDVAHAPDRYHDLKVEPLAAGRRRDPLRPASAKERRHLLRRPHG